jgi:hypothetical protein
VGGTLPPFDASRPSIARVYDYWLGGKDNFAADRELAEQMLDPVTGYPGLRDRVAENRRFVARAVRWAAAMGITRFLDLGAGLPTPPAVHQAARETEPHAKVVYVDNDPVVCSHLDALAAAPGIAAVQADLTDPAAVLARPEVTDILGSGEPGCVILAAVLHFLPAAAARAVVAGYMNPLSPGSCAIISVAHFDDEALSARLAALYRRAGTWHNHAREDVESFFAAAGLRLARGEVADIACWPMLPAARAARECTVLGGIGLKD